MLLDGYIRVSKVGGRSGPSFISPVVQREQIERWAAAHDVTLGRIFEELDESGARSDRPLLLEALRRVDRHESDGVIVAYLSRFGRSLVDAMNAIKRITDVGGTFVSVQEGLDLSTDTGRLVLRMLFSIAEWERDRNRTYLDQASARAVARGVRMGTVPFGYRRAEDGRLTPHPEHGPVVSELFRRRAGGIGINELRRWLIDTKVRPEKHPRYWYELPLHRIFERRVYRGELHFGRFVNLHAHEPLVDEDIWQRAQVRHLRVPAQHSRRPALLRGLLRCEGCQMAMYVNTERSGSSIANRMYHCQDRRGRCRTRANIADVLVEPYVEALFWQELPRWHAARRGKGIRRLERLVARREQELVAYRDNPRLPRTLGEERFASGLAVRVRRLEKARLELANVRIVADESLVPAPNELRERWSTMTVNDRRLAIAEVFECVFVSRTGQPIEDRVVVCLRGQGPAPMKYDPDDPAPAKPFDPRTCPRRPRLKRRHRPPVEFASLRHELDALLEGQTSWPPFQFFQAHGRVDLYEDVRRSGGPRSWAFELNLPFQSPNRVRAWSDPRIRKELRRFLRGKDTWPSYREFREEGYLALREAIRWAGGADRWAAEMGVELDPLRRSPFRDWSYSTLRQGVLELAGDSQVWPSRRQFMKAGKGGLLAAIDKLGVREQLRGDLGLASQPLGRPRVWSDQRIAEKLDELLEDRDTWPTERELAAMHLAGLRCALKRRGLRAWTARYGFEPPRQGRRGRRLTRIAHHNERR
jgi:DNA invertase Pin-like site-specific DNA recombinase